MYKLKLNEVKESLNFQKAFNVRTIEHNNYSGDGFWTQGAYTIKTYQTYSNNFDTLNIFFLHIQSMPFYSKTTFKEFDLWDKFFQEEYTFEPIDEIEFKRLAKSCFELFRGFTEDHLWDSQIYLDEYIKGYKVSKDWHGVTYLVCETKERYYSFVFFGLD